MHPIHKFLEIYTKRRSEVLNIAKETNCNHLILGKFTTFKYICIIRSNEWTKNNGLS